MNKSILALGVIFAALLAGCAGQPTSYRASCADEITAAWQDLNFAKAEGFAGTVSYSKAFSLISTAKTLQTIEKFESCYNQAKKARFYISESRQGR